MKLILNRNDLGPSYKSVNVYDTEFKHFSRTARRAIMLTGKAIFYEDDNRYGNTIHRPEETVIMSDGFGADTIKLYTAPIETDGPLVKLTCAVPGKEYMIRWARKSDVEKALKEQP